MLFHIVREIFGAKEKNVAKLSIAQRLGRDLRSGNAQTLLLEPNDGRGKGSSFCGIFKWFFIGLLAITQTSKSHDY